MSYDTLGKDTSRSRALSADCPRARALPRLFSVCWLTLP
jgi:hypothetical protein